MEADDLWLRSVLQTFQSRWCRCEGGGGGGGGGGSCSLVFQTQERVSRAAFMSSCRTGRETTRSEVQLRGSCNCYFVAEHSPRLHHLPRKASSNNPPKQQQQQQQRQTLLLAASVTENRTPFRCRRLIASPLQGDNITCLVMKSTKKKKKIECQRVCISLWTLYHKAV